MFTLHEKREEKKKARTRKKTLKAEQANTTTIAQYSGNGSSISKASNVNSRHKPLFPQTIMESISKLCCVYFPFRKKLA